MVSPAAIKAFHFPKIGTIAVQHCRGKDRAMPWMATLLAALALALHCVDSGNRFAAYDELQIPRNMPKRCSRYLGDCKDSVGAEAQAQAQAVDLQGTSKMLNALFGLTQSTPQATLPAHPNPNPTEAALTPYQLPPMYYNDFYEDLLTSKRNDVHSTSCDCKVMNDLIDLGSRYFPRYLMTSICEPLDVKCTQGSNCKPLEYKVKVLTLAEEQLPLKAAGSATSSARLWLPEQVTQLLQWEFETVTVTAGCFCTS